MSTSVYVFSGIATVSVTCSIEAKTESGARAMLKSGDCEWRCDEVDGEVTEVEMTHEEE